MAQPKVNQRRYIGGFDGLRTLAVLGVILYHLRADLFPGGYLGVPIFLVISGYLITDGFFREYSRTGGLDLKTFFIKRVKRLYPGMIAVLFASAAYIYLFDRALLVNLYRIVISNLLLVYNWWQIFNGQSYFDRFANNESPFTHLWTLSIEGQFYILMPLLFLLLVRLMKSRDGVFYTLFGLAVLSAIWMGVLYTMTMHGEGADPSRLYYGTDTRISALLIGAALGAVWPSDRFVQTRSKKPAHVLDAIGTVAMLGIVFGIFTLGAQGSELYLGGMFVFSLLVTLVVAVVAHPQTRWGKLLSNPVFHYIGSRSYGIYLYQFPVMIFWENAIGNVAAHPVIYPLIEVALIVGLSEISYRFIEQPIARFDFRTLKDWFTGLFAAGGRWKTRSIALVSTAILIVGAMGVAASPQAKDKANDSELAKRLNKNKETDAQKEAALKKQQSRIAAQKASSKAAAAASSSAAALPPVNEQWEKYGLTQPQLHRLYDLPITAVGDSVMLDGKPYLQELMPNCLIDAAVSRQVYNSTDILSNYRAKNALSDVVLIGLGTNGPFTEDQMKEMIDAIGPERQIFWINVNVSTRSWQGTVNNLLEASKKKYANLHVIDWYGYSRNHPEWFYDDHVHPNPDGSYYYAAFIAKEIVNQLPDKK